MGSFVLTFCYVPVVQLLTTYLFIDGYRQISNFFFLHQLMNWWYEIFTDIYTIVIRVKTTPFVFSKKCRVTFDTCFQHSFAIMFTKVPSVLLSMVAFNLMRNWFQKWPCIFFGVMYQKNKQWPLYFVSGAIVTRFSSCDADSSTNVYKASYMTALEISWWMDYDICQTFFNGENPL